MISQFVGKFANGRKYLIIGFIELFTAWILVDGKWFYNPSSDSLLGKIIEFFLILPIFSQASILGFLMVLIGSGTYQFFLLIFHSQIFSKKNPKKDGSLHGFYQWFNPDWKTYILDSCVEFQNGVVQRKDLIQGNPNLKKINGNENNHNNILEIEQPFIAANLALFHEKKSELERREAQKREYEFRRLFFLFIFPAFAALFKCELVLFLILIVFVFLALLETGSRSKFLADYHVKFTKYVISVLEDGASLLNDWNFIEKWLHLNDGAPFEENGKNLEEILKEQGKEKYLKDEYYLTIKKSNNRVFRKRNFGNITEEY